MVRPTNPTRRNYTTAQQVDDNNEKRWSEILGSTETSRRPAGLPDAGAASVHGSTGTGRADRPRPSVPPPQPGPSSRSRRASPRPAPASWAVAASESSSPADGTQADRSRFASPRWLGGLVVRALDSQLDGREFHSRPRRLILGWMTVISVLHQATQANSASYPQRDMKSVSVKVQ